MTPQTTHLLAISGMSCEQCARHVENALATLAGVQAAVSYPERLARVTAPIHISRARIRRTIESAGYQANPVNGIHLPTGRDGADRHIAIIGSGAGAFAAAIRAAEAGARVTMIEKGVLGGTCVNVGCVPSKITLRAAEVIHERAHHPFNGIPVNGGEMDRDALQRQLNARISELRQSKYQNTLDTNPDIQLLQGQARFEDPRTVVVDTPAGDPERIRPDCILIATGASPVIPPIDGLSDTPFWTSTEALFTGEVPPHLAVIGGSFVALEIAQAYRRFGSEVTLIARSTLLSREDPEIGLAMRGVFEDEGIRVFDHIQTRRVRHNGEHFHIETHGPSITADSLLVATGRRPNTDMLNLAVAGVERNKHGAIRIDDRLQTSVEHIYAAGDCTDMPQLVYVAAAAGTRAATNMIGGDARLDLSVVPVVVFTDPQVATVGLDELTARRTGIETDSRRIDVEHVPRALANFDNRGFIKLVVETETRRLLGAQIVAHSAGEMIQAAALAIRYQMTVESFANELFPYLTMTEGLKLCAQTFTKDISKLSCCAG